MPQGPLGTRFVVEHSEVGAADPLDGFFSVVALEVAWGDMDAWEHVNNTMYFRYLETARLRYLWDLGWGALEREGLLPVVGRVEARFLRPLRFPASLRVGTRPRELRAARVVLEHHVVTREGPHTAPVLATVGVSEVVPFDARRERVVRVPEAIFQAIAAQLEARR
jgi:acyl-CoA thioester hydrolase